MKTPKVLIVFNTFLMVGFLLPLVYLFWRFFSFSGNILSLVENWDVLTLLINTISLFFTVVISSVFLGISVAVLIFRYRVPFSRIILTMLILPLVIPSYIGALTYISMFSPKGLYVQIFSFLGIQEINGIGGFFGSWVVLTLFTFPYVLLIFGNGLSKLDSSIEEAARSLGVSGLSLYFKIVFPRLKKQIIYSALLVGLYVISDFGAVSLMRFRTITKAIYTYYEFNINGDPVIFYSVLIIFLSLIISLVQRGSTFSSSSKISENFRTPVKKEMNYLLKFLSIIFLGLLILFSLILPVSVLIYWITRGISLGNGLSLVFDGVLGSIAISGITSMLAIVISIPIVVMLYQYKNNFSYLIERILLTMYGLPHIAVGVSILFISIKVFPSTYQSFPILVLSYLIVFLPQVIAGGQGSIEQVKVSYIDASMGLGKRKVETFFKVTLPIIYKGLFAGGALVFLSTMKELPQTLLLRPTGFSTMAVDIWSYASEGLFTQAAFSAFIMLAISAFPTYILSTRNLT